MRHEREHQPRPAWQQTLEQYQKAFYRLSMEPTIGTRIFFELAAKQLELETNKPDGLIQLGLVSLTPGAIEALKIGKHLAEEFLIRHKWGDFGDLCDEDKQLNRAEIPYQGRILSSYHTRREEKLWVITDPGWQTSTILKPEEY